MFHFKLESTIRQIISGHQSKRVAKLFFILHQQKGLGCTKAPFYLLQYMFKWM